MVRALDIEDGNTLWVNQFDLNDSSDRLNLATIVEGKVMTAGRSGRVPSLDGSVAASDLDTVVRALDLGVCF